MANDHSSYDERKRREAERQAEQSRAGREIGQIPNVVDPERKARATEDFRFYCETYFPRTFRFGWSDDHLYVLELVQQAVLEGMLQAVAMPRGSGKSSICQRAIIWAIICGHHRYGVLICADEGKAKNSLKIIKTELESNELLAADFPEVVYPIRKLERIANRAKGQTYQGEPTRIEWTNNSIVLPTIAGSPASGGILGTGGIESAVRGAVHLDGEGNQIRPSIILIDDPQTRESARSELQSELREQLVSADILGMAGPDGRISALMPCTVIRKGDMADRILNRQIHPDWRGVRTQMVRSMPERMDLWQQYAELRADSLRNDGKGEPALKFYRKNRKAMDSGAEVSWEERKNEGDLSALQTAMNLYFRDQHGFASEYQNEPIDERDESAFALLPPEDIGRKRNGLARGVLPSFTEHVTAFIDVQKRNLWWMVCGWGSDFRGAVIDYGCFPDQGDRRYYTKSDITKTLGRKYPGMQYEAQVRAALLELTDWLYSREWIRDGDNAQLDLDRLHIDEAYAPSRDMIHEVCRLRRRSGMMPARGIGYTVKGTPFGDKKKSRGETVGDHWRIPPIQGKRTVRFVHVDVNHWKTFVHRRLLVATGDPGSIALFGTDRDPGGLHRMLADHLHAEVPTEVTANERTGIEWTQRPNRPDEDLFDCLVGNAVAASICGADLADRPGKPRGKQAPLKLSELQRRRRGG